MWDGDFHSSIKILKDIDMGEVVRFAEEALEVERLLLTKSQEDLEDVVSSIAKREEVCCPELAAEFRREMASMRESILSEVRSILTPSGSTRLTKSNIEIGESKIPAVESAVTALTVTETPISQKVEPKITQEIIHAELVRTAPISANFLDAARFFSLSPATETDILPYQFFSVASYNFEKKKRTFRTILQSMVIEPVGWLHLERLQFTPLGYERGELVYSLPLVPGETVRLSHREWSRTETEFSKLVYTQLETATEEALSEKSELTQSSNVQQQHSSGHNASVTASGGYGKFNMTASYSYNCSDSESKSRQDASKRAQDITKKASSRVKKEHKVSFKVTTTYELEEQSFREISNKLDREVRWDFHRLMKKWRIDLYRYDIRLTYDIVIPEPGSYLLRKYFLLKAISDELEKPNQFNISPGDISRSGDNSWEALSKTYGVSLEQPPRDIFHAEASEIVTISGKDGFPGWQTRFLQITLPDGYEFYIPWQASMNDIHRDYVELYPAVHLVDSDGHFIEKYYGSINGYASENWIRLYKREPKGQTYLWPFEYSWHTDEFDIPSGTTMSIKVKVRGKLTDEGFKAWQIKCYERLVDAAKVQYEAKQQRLKQIRDELLEELNREDALMLRKLEKEELMKGILRWLIGPTFSFYPQNVLKLPDLTVPKYLQDFAIQDFAIDVAGNLEYYDPTTKSVKEEYWKPALQYGELIKFLHHAIEWENINYVLYPYFWTDEPRWDFKQYLYHGDYIHRSFLRAGAARVVLTIRPDFVKDFLCFMEGSIDQLLPSDHHYMSIADELEALGKSNYPYTQDANVEKEEYVFTWENVPGNEEGRLKRYLRQSFYIHWAEDDEATIVKLDEGKTIILSIDKTTMVGGFESKIEGSVEIKLDESKNRVYLKITDGKTYDLKVKTEGNIHKIFREQNLIDTWYEYTPTGALDVVEGSVLN